MSLANRDTREKRETRALQGKLALKDQWAHREHSGPLACRAPKEKRELEAQMESLEFRGSRGPQVTKAREE